MTDITVFLKKNEKNLVQIINSLNRVFSSHDFIEKFSQKFESEYIEMLVDYKDSGKAFQTVHSIIAKYLSNNMDTFQIIKTEKKGSENVFGSIDNIQWWNKM